MKAKYADIGLFKTSLGRTSSPATVQLLRVRENPGPGQYVFNEDDCSWQLHPEELGHFTGNYLSTETEPGSSCLRMREIAEKSWTVSAHTLKLSELPGMQTAKLEAQLAEMYIRTMYPEQAETILARANNPHEHSPVWDNALRYVRFFMAGVALLTQVQP